MVIENEVGEISIDHDLIPSTGVIVMKNGCMCCSVSQKAQSNELEHILDHLMAVLSSDHEQYDALVVETSGLADPGPIIRCFLQLRSSIFQLDSVITMVDTHSFHRFYPDHLPFEMEAQLLHADTVILNKIDLIAQDKLMEIETIIQENYNTKIWQNSKTQPMLIDPLLNVQTFDHDRFYQISHKTTVKHSPNVHCARLKLDRDIPMPQFVNWMQQIVKENEQNTIFRVKGVVAIESEPIPVLIQCVLDTYTISHHPTLRWIQREERQTDLVVIGQHVDQQRLQASLDSSAELEE